MLALYQQNVSAQYMSALYQHGVSVHRGCERHPTAEDLDAQRPNVHMLKAFQGG